MKYCKAVLDIQTNAFSDALTFAICKDEDSILGDVKCSLKQNIDLNACKEYDVEIGSIIVVPFGKQFKLAFVVDIFDEDHLDHIDKFKKLKPVLYCVSESFFNKWQAEFAKFLTDKYLASYTSCLRSFIPAGSKVKLKHIDNVWQVQSHNFRETDKNLMDRHFPENSTLADWKNFELTQGQNNALNKISDSLLNNKNNIFVIDGVTGSGKTEIYLRAIQTVLDKGKTALVLVPEISLTPQTVNRFKERFPGKIAVIHSKMTQAERHNQFKLIKSEQLKVVVGARSALFSPLQNLGIIIMDEEHSSSYKQDKNPRYSTRTCIEWLANKNNCVAVLGSATPSFESIYKCNNEPNWHLLTLDQRTNKLPLPKIELVDMSNEFKSGSKNMFSKSLEKYLLEELKSGNKIILFHNRRGFSNYVFCRNCGYIPICKNCTTKLTFHHYYNVKNQTKQMLACHHCGYSESVPVICPECGSPYIAKYGVGTQNLEDNIRVLLHQSELDNVNLIRMDADTTRHKDGHQQCLDSFAQPGPAILLGTQMIAKGLDFSEVTLVGIVLVDTNLCLPDFRSAERTFDLILQVAGRCGRSQLPGRVVVQTYLPEEECIECASQYNKDLFYKIELNKRRLLNYPPFSYLANIIISAKSEEEAKLKSKEIQALLENYISDNNIDYIDILPSTSCVLEKIRNQYRYHILVKSKLDIELSTFLNNVFKFYKQKSSIKVSIDVEPNTIF